jgi:hypothetical protein
MNGILNRIDADLIEPQRLAESVIDQFKVERRKAPTAGPRGITAREALQVLSVEAQLVALASQNIARGIKLNDLDNARLMVAWARITTIISEAGR